MMVTNYCANNPDYYPSKVAYVSFTIFLPKNADVAFFHLDVPGVVLRGVGIGVGDASSKEESLRMCSGPFLFFGKDILEELTGNSNKDAAKSA